MTLTNLKTAPPLPSNSPEWFLRGSTPDVLTSDFVIRSLRRRLWKAFQEDSVDSALRAYQATKEDFEAWLLEEQEQREELFLQQAAKEGGKLKDIRSSFLGKKPSSRRSLTAGVGGNGSGFFSSSVGKKGSVRRRGSTGEVKEFEAAAAAAASIYQTSSFYALDLKNLKGPILQSQMNPSEPFIADDFLSPYDLPSYEYPARKDLPSVAKHEREQQAKLAKRRRRSSKGPRIAAFTVFRRSSATATDEAALEATPQGSGETADSEDGLAGESMHMTTPLHEAARLGSGDFIRVLLSNGGDPNVKNGMARTALHMTSGGLTTEEDQLRTAQQRKHKRADTEPKLEQPTPHPEEPIGIRSPDLPTEVFALMKEELYKSNKPKGSARKAANKMGRLVRSALGSSASRNKEQEVEARLLRGKKVKTNPKRLNHLISERMDAVLAVLSWIHKDTCEGASINAVDTDGRTALHYAAQTGRSDICMAILSNFGAMLTIIDELGARTPCELAGRNGHPELAAQLEARALLYIDPYGVDDELMANMMNREGGFDGSPRSALVAPFAWYETRSLQTAGDERSERLQSAWAKLLRAIQSWDTSTNSIEAPPSANSKSPALEIKELEGVDEDVDRKPSAEVEQTKSMNPMASVMAAAEKNGLGPALGIADSSDHEKGDEAEASNPLKLKKDPIRTASTLQADFLNLKEHHVERLLAYHHWNVSNAVRAFKKAPKNSFEKAGIPIPYHASIPKSELTERTCLICYDDQVQQENWISLSDCDHGFCSDCLVDYIKDCAASKTPLFSIACPHHECEVIMSKLDIDRVLDSESEVLQLLENATNEQFVVAAHDFKFCNHPGCVGVVHQLPQPYLAKNGIDFDIVNYTGAVCTMCPKDGETNGMIGEDCPLTYEGVEDLEYRNCRSLDQPRKAHRFCFSCGEKNHWPVPCERLDVWHDKIQEEIGEVKEDNEDETAKGSSFADLAQKMWIKANTRPCPQCNVPIEKNDGCNHMTCTNPTCRHEFCWICRKDWKLHGTATGGFFRCNIWQEEGQEPIGEDGKPIALPGPSGAGDLDPMDQSSEGFGTAIHSAREQYRQRQEMNRFLHHYTRWEAHDESAALERRMGDSVCTRLAPVVEAAIEFDGSPGFNFGGKGLSFVHSAFTELLECRSVLKHSYAFSFFRYPTFYQFKRYGQLNNRRREKMSFERLQSELEMITEQMSDIVARSHLRATQVQITFLTAGASEKREEFTNLMFTILNEERKEAKTEKKAPSAASARSTDRTHERRASRRYRIPSASTLEGRLRRLLADDAWGGVEDLDDWSSGEEGTNNGIRAGLDELLTRSLTLDHGASHEPATRMWECSACTYMNDGGHRCAMCGSLR